MMSMNTELSSEPSSLSNHFLMAMPNMADPNFDGALVLIAEHSSDGAMGLVVNRLMPFDLGSLFERIDLNRPASGLAEQSVLFGGPVQSDRGFVLHRPTGQWHASINISGSLTLTSSRDVLEAVASHKGPDEVLVALGYAGWGPGQLESELSQNAWLTVAADPSVLFETPGGERLARAFNLLGVDPAFLHGAAGHA